MEKLLTYIVLMAGWISITVIFMVAIFGGKITIKLNYRWMKENQDD